MKCPRCAYKNPQGARFCEECAAPLARTCLSCGASLSATAKFCHACAHPVAGGPTPLRSPDSYTPKHLAERILTSKAALEGERKQVTVLFADLKGSMELLADRDPEEARTILDPALEYMMEAVHRYEGTVNQVMGDGIMALFGAPLAHEDHAVRACYAALRMQQTVMRYGNDVQRVYGLPLELRVGLNSGDVVVRSIGSDLRMDYTAVGETTHLAGRMEQIAKAGSILATAETTKLVEGYVQVERIGPVNVKGLSKPIEAYEIVMASRVRTRMQAIASRGLTPFVGRQTELRMLRKSLEAAEAGNGQVVAIVGEPGVGKSRLLWEFAHTHQLRRWLVLEANCVSYGKTNAYLPIVDLLRAYFNIEGPDDPRRVEEKVAVRLLTLDRKLDDILPALLGLLDVVAEKSEWAALDPPRRRQRIFDAVLRLLVRESQIQPIALLFEDLHWIDSETEAVLDYLVQNVATARVLMLINYRPDYQHGWGAKPYYTELPLEALPPRSAKELADNLLGDDRALAGLKAVLMQQTEGNAFFIEETVRAFVETGILVGKKGQYRLAKDVKRARVAPTIQAVLAARIDRLPAMPKQLLQCAAVVGKDVPLSILEGIADLSDTELQHGVAALQAADFLHRTQSFPELEYTFKHGLTLEVAYAGILHGRRRELHARIAEVIERLHPDSTPYIEQLAHHAFAGAAWEQAVRYSRKAGAKALARSASRHAVSHFEQALAALQHLPDAPEMTAIGIDLRFDLRNALHPLGELQTALAYLTDAERLAREVNDQRRLGWVSIYTSGHLWQIGETIEALKCAERGYGIAEKLADVELEVAGEFYAGQACFILGDYKRSEALLRKALAPLQGDRNRQLLGLAGLPSVLAGSYLAWALAEQGDFGNGVRHGQDALGIAETADHHYSLILALWRLGLVYLVKGDAKDGLQLFERAFALCRDSGLTLLSPYVSWSLGSAYAVTGRITEGVSFLTQSIDSLERTGLGAFHALAVTRLAEAYGLANRFDDANACAHRALSLTQERGERGFEAYARRALADIESRANAADAAETHYRQAISLADELNMRPLMAHCHLGMGTLYRHVGQQEHARRQLTTAMTMYRDMGMTYWLEKVQAELS